MKSPRERLVLIVDAKCAKFFHTKNFKMKGEIHLSTIDDFDISHKVHSSSVVSPILDTGHAKELDRKDFCKKVMHAVQDEYHQHKFDELIIVAGPKILGDLRTNTPKELKHLDIQEIHKDLTHFSKEKIEEYLREIC
ncbi:MAG: host attachment protein [Rickettsiales bacterium]|nr:host attachment protein [Rickettsiales bacterium]